MQFLDSGCENCINQSMMGDGDRVLECTTSDFQGLITVLNPGSSWTARWLHIGELPQVHVFHILMCRLLHRSKGLQHASCYSATLPAAGRAFRMLYQLQEVCSCMLGMHGLPCPAIDFGKLT